MTILILESVIGVEALKEDVCRGNGQLWYFALDTHTLYELTSVLSIGQLLFDRYGTIDVGGAVGGHERHRGILG